jgi:hypothetical protein
MKPMSLSEAVAAIRDMPPEGRGSAVRNLAEALGHRVGAGAGFTVFDPLECTPDIGGLCPHRVRRLAGEDRLCLAWLDPEVACPHSREPA